MKDKKTFIITGASVNHNGNLNKALKLVDITIKSEKLSEISKVKETFNLCNL
tara:strand:- start:296 stop:451 length:156 start_codon:yes stop_codon:yes gene_type:complete